MTDTVPTLLLASQSPRRRQLLATLGVPFHTCAVDVDEQAVPFHGWRACVALARMKAEAAAARHPDAIALGADTLVFLDGRPLGKPAGREEAAAFLGALAGRSHEVVSGVCLVGERARVRCFFAERTTVFFKPLDKQDIARYLDSVHVLDKAGAYAIQERGSEIVERVEGSRSNVIGLPLERLSETLALLGYPVERPLPAPPAETAA